MRSNIMPVFGQAQYYLGGNMSYTVNQAKNKLKHILDNTHVHDDMADVMNSLQEVYDMLDDPNEGFLQWSADDFIDLAKQQSRYISEEKAQEALRHMIRKHDCTLGITWDTLSCYLDEYAEGELWECYDCKEFIPEPDLDLDNEDETCPHCKSRRIRKYEDDED